MKFVMKNATFSLRFACVAGALLLVPLACSLGADSTTNPAATTGDTNEVKSAPLTPLAAPASTPAPTKESAKLPYGTDEVVKLTHAQVGDDVVVSYVQNSGTAYSLSPDDIVRLRNEGVSDRVINAMMDQHKKAVEVAQRASGPAPVYRDNNNPAPVYRNNNPAPVYTDNNPGPTYTDNTSSAAPTTEAPPQGAPVPSAPQQAVEAPLTPQGSSVYTIPYAPSTPIYDYPYPYYYGPYYYGGGPVIGFRFGFGGHGHFHHWH